MNKIFLALFFPMTTVAAANNLPDVAFAKYRILSQGIMSDEKKTPVTYIVTASPPMAIMVLSNESTVIKRVATGKLKSCRRIGVERETLIQNTAAQLAGTLGEMEMIASMSSAHGQPLSREKQEDLENLRNYVSFVNESIRKPMFFCEVPNSATTSQKTVAIAKDTQE